MSKTLPITLAIGYEGIPKESHYFTSYVQVPRIGETIRFTETPFCTIIGQVVDVIYDYVHSRILVKVAINQENLHD